MSIKVDDELARRLYHTAVDSRCSVSELVERALRRGFEEGWLPGAQAGSSPTTGIRKA
ncbi:MAG: CopG family transcriptional regulator [Nitrososphaeria archaeon]